MLFQATCNPGGAAHAAREQDRRKARLERMRAALEGGDIKPPVKAAPSAAERRRRLLQRMASLGIR